MKEHIESKTPTLKGVENPQIAQFRNALAEAKRHLKVLQGLHADDALQIRVQQRIIRGWESRIAGITGDWTNA